MQGSWQPTSARATEPANAPASRHDKIEAHPAHGRAVEEKKMARLPGCARWSAGFSQSEKNEVLSLTG
jgi:hypothetical protein